MADYYGGIGSRKTPPDILDIMTKLANKLSLGYVLRSGGATGADSAFERGSNGIKEVFYAKDATEEAIKLSSKYHPNWEACSDYARKLHGRNSMILLGEDLVTPVKFVVCWTEGSKIKGGTGQALRIAEDFQIPIYNLANDYWLDRVLFFINENN